MTVPHRIRNPKIIAIIFIATFFFVAVILLSILGGVDFGREYPKVLHYANTMCQVNTIDYQRYECQARYSTYACYGPVWDAHYGPNKTIYAKVETEKRYRSYLDALHKAQEYHIGMSYSCWYDTRNPSTAQWDKPSIVVQAILLGCGGLSLLLCILFFFISARLVRQEKLQREQNGFYSNEYSVK